MLIPLILTAAVLASLWLLCAFRLARAADDSSDEIARQLAEQGWAHCPPLCGCRGGADSGLPFEHRGVGNRGRLNHRGAE